MVMMIVLWIIQWMQVLIDTLTNAVVHRVTSFRVDLSEPSKGGDVSQFLKLLTSWNEDCVN